MKYQNIIIVGSLTFTFAILGWAMFSVNFVMGDMQNCINLMKADNIAYNDAFEPENHDWNSFNEIYHSENYQCDRWWGYDKTVERIKNNNLNDDYFNDWLWRYKGNQPE